MLLSEDIHLKGLWIQIKTVGRKQKLKNVKISFVVKLHTKSKKKKEKNI